MADNLTTAALEPLPPKRRPIVDRWQVGDVVQMDGVRWIIRTLDRQAGRVELETSNVSPGIHRTTSIDRLPAKTPAGA